MDKPKIKVPDSVKEIDKQIEALENQIAKDTKEINRIRYDRDIHRRALADLTEARMNIIDKEVFNSKGFDELVNLDKMESNPEREWILEEVGREFALRNPKLKGAQFIGFGCIDEPNQISIMVNSKVGILFVDVFYEEIGNKKLRINKVRDVSSDLDLEW